MTKLFGVVPLPSTLSGFLKGTSAGVEQVDEASEGAEFPTLFRAITRKV